VTHAFEQYVAELLRGIWRALNRILFAGRLLREPEFRLMRSRVLAADFTPGGARDHIRVNVAYFRGARRLPLADLLDTLAHEMLHQWQWETDRPVRHDRWFRREAAAMGISA
jgi:hypothetical protein